MLTNITSNDTVEPVATSNKNNAHIDMLIMSKEINIISENRCKADKLKDNQIIERMRKITAIQELTEADLLEWVGYGTAAIDRGMFPAALPLFVNPSIKSKSNGKYSGANLRKANVKKLLDLYFIFKKFPYLLEGNGSLDEIISGADEVATEFDFVAGLQQSSHHISTLMRALALPKYVQLFYCASLKEPDVSEEYQHVRKTLTNLRKRALIWLSQSKRHQSNDGRSVVEQVNDILLTCRALLAVGGRLQAAADILESVTGEKKARGVIATSKKRIERIMGVKDSEAFWGYKEIKDSDVIDFDDDEDLDGVV